MSTILKALRRLEHDKQAEAARERSHDPLAPALAAAEPTAVPAGRRPWASWLAAVALAAAVGAGASYGLASWWISRSSAPGSVDVASASPQAPAPLAAVPRRVAQARAAAAEAPTFESADASAPPRFAEARRQPELPAHARASGSGSTSTGAGGTATQGEAVLAQAAASNPDPWEAAAHAAPPVDRSGPKAVRTEQVMPMDSPPGASSTASGRAAAAPSAVEGAVAISSLPELTLPEPAPVVAPRPAASMRSAKAVTPPPARVPASSSSPADSARPTPSAAASDSGGRLEIQVLKTVWHPKPERRSARVRLSDRVEVLEVHQGDVVEGYLISEITPSSVVLARGEDELTYRVGR